jgi:threonine dehydratase
MFDLPALEAAAALVHGVFPGTPQYAWPLLG